MAAVSKASPCADTDPVKPHLKPRLVWLSSGLILLTSLVWIYLQPQEPSIAILQAKPKAVPKAVESVEIPAALVAQMRRLAQEQMPTTEPPKPKPLTAQTKPLITQLKPQPTQAKPSDHTSALQPKAKNRAHRFKTGGAPALNVDAPEAQTAIASSVDQDGTIPSLSIDLAGHSSEQMARYYHLALAVQSFEAQALLGILIENQLHPVAPTDLAQYSSRGRSADGLQDAFDLKGRIATQSGRAFDDIGLLYLVPKKVDDGWIAWQRQVVTQAGYTFGEVEEVKARYAENLALEAYALVLKQGQIIHLKDQL
jgi:hypothetical protein